MKSLYNATLNPSLSLEDKRHLLELLAKHHSILFLEGERGETSLFEFAIDTGDAFPKNQAAHRITHAAREEINNQLTKMQIKGMIQPSESLWASPVVLVRKRDGSLSFFNCRSLNEVVKANVHPLLRIDDLLDKLGRAKYFST